MLDWSLDRWTPCEHTVAFNKITIHPFHTVAPHVKEAFPWPIQDQANCHVKSNNSRDPKSNMSPMQWSEGVKSSWGQSTMPNSTKLASNKFLSLHLEACGGVGSQD